MLLYLMEAIKASGSTEHYFFRMAYQWKFNKALCSTKDADDFKAHGDIPPYVRDYIIHLQQERGGGSSMATGN